MNSSSSSEKKQALKQNTSLCYTMRHLLDTDSDCERLHNKQNMTSHLHINYPLPSQKPPIPLIFGLFQKALDLQTPLGICLGLGTDFENCLILHHQQNLCVYRIHKIHDSKLAFQPEFSLIFNSKIPRAYHRTELDIMPVHIF